MRIRIPGTLKARVSKAAEEDESSMSDVVRKAIRQYLEGENGKGPSEYSNS